MVVDAWVLNFQHIVIVLVSCIDGCGTQTVESLVHFQSILSLE